MWGKRSKQSGIGQQKAEIRDRLEECMDDVGFVPGTQKAYLREYDRFIIGAGAEAGETATRQDLHHYLAELKRTGASANTCSNASASLRFLIEQVRGETWEAPMSPLRRRMTEDMQLAGFSKKTQASYISSVDGLARYAGGHRCNWMRNRSASTSCP